MLGLIHDFLGLGLVLFGLLMYVAFSFLVRGGFRPTIRPLPAYDRLSDHVGQAIESGGRLHVSLGPGSIIGTRTVTTIAGLSILDEAAGQSTIGDHPPVVTTGDATTLPAAADGVRRAYRRTGQLEHYTTQSARLVALDATSLAGGATSIIHDDHVKTNILVGSFGPEVTLMAEAGKRLDIPQTIGSDRLEGIAAAFALADDPLIGEELYVSRAYLTDDASATGALAAQDILRWGIIALIIFGTVLQTLGLAG
jgi:hypothetical protein